MSKARASAAEVGTRCAGPETPTRWPLRRRISSQSPTTVPRRVIMMKDDDDGEVASLQDTATLSEVVYKWAKDGGGSATKQRRRRPISLRIHLVSGDGVLESGAILSRAYCMGKQSDTGARMRV